MYLLKGESWKAYYIGGRVITGLGFIRNGGRFLSGKLLFSEGSLT
jgi:hypothetical protein